MAESTLQGGLLKNTKPSPKTLESGDEKAPARGSLMAVAVLRFVVVVALLFVVWEGCQVYRGRSVEFFDGGWGADQPNMAPTAFDLCGE